MRGRGLRHPLPDGVVPEFGLYLLNGQPESMPWSSAASPSARLTCSPPSSPGAPNDFQRGLAFPVLEKVDDPGQCRHRTGASTGSLSAPTAASTAPVPNCAGGVALGALGAEQSGQRLVPTGLRLSAAPLLVWELLFFHGLGAAQMLCGVDGLVLAATASAVSAIDLVGGDSRGARAGGRR